jgi:hypothetical protein
MIQNHDEPCTKAEEEIFKERMTEFSKFEATGVKQLKMASPLTAAKLAVEDGDRVAFGYAVTVVRAQPVKVLAYLWDFVSREHDVEGELVKTVKSNGDHNQVLYLKKTLPGWNVSNRDWLTEYVWRPRGSGFDLVSRPTTSAAHQVTKDVVRATFPSACKIRDAGDGQTRLEYVREQRNVQLLTRR